MTGNEAQTWHYGLVARYWAEHRVGGPEIAYFQHQIEDNGQPALDAGCGTGRLLIPFLQAGIDVDGCDVSADMLDFCREKAEREGLSPRLYQTTLHELDLPRRYETILACGVLGIGTTRQQDFAALQRFYEHLNPDGLLLMDHFLPYSDAKEWTLWQKTSRSQLPEEWPTAMRKAAPDQGTGYKLFSRIVAFDPLEQRVTREMRALSWDRGQLVAEEEYTLVENLYFCNELCQLLERAGFTIEAIRAAYMKREATADDDVIVFVARK